MYLPMPPYQQLNLKNKRKKQNQKETKQTTRTGTELWKWRSHGVLSAGGERGKNEGKGAVIKKHTW